MIELFSRASLRSVLSCVLSFSLLLPPAGAQPYPAASRPAQTAIAQAAGTASLNFPPAQGDSAALQCDQLADPPADPLRVGNGVSFQRIQVDQALSACQQAAARLPMRPRYQYLYGRSLVAAKRYSEAVAQYSSADRAGYGMASFDLAQLYRDGLGVSRDWSPPARLDEAVRLYFRAGNAGIADAFAEGGLLFASETPPNYPEAKTWFEHAVQGGSADGYANLGWLYELGYGVRQDVTTALSLFNEASKRGSAEGMYRVGVAYYDGIGVRKDLAAACQWFIRAASYGHPNGEYQAGRCYYNGIGVQQNHETAYNFFVPAGQAGLVDARVFVAYMIDSGDGHPKDEQAAVQWYRAAAEQGDVFAMTQLGVHLRLGQGVARSEAQAMQWFGTAAQKGYVPAETSLAVGYEYGLGQDAGQGRQDYQQAFNWLSKAAQQGDGFAELNLGVMYEKGWGVQQNLDRAKQLYAQAAASSDTHVADLGRQYFSSVPVSAPPDRTPERTVASASKSSSDSSDVWAAVIVGALAIGAISALTSSGSTSSSGSGSGGGGVVSTDSGVNWPTSSPAPVSPPPRLTPIDPRNPSKAVNGDLSDPNLIWR